MSNSFQSLLQMGRTSQSRNQLPEAEHYFRLAAELDPSSYEAGFGWALSLFRIGDLDNSEAQAKKVIELDLDKPEAHELLGAILAQTDRHGNAVEEFTAAVSLSVNAPASAFLGIVSNKKITRADQPLLDKMTLLLAQLPSPANRHLVLHVCLGKAMDDLREYGESMRHFDTARRLSFQQNHVRRFDKAGTQATIENFKKYFSKEIVSRPGQGVDSELPIFIVGMPRSGSTLLEQILTSHQQI